VEFCIFDKNFAMTTLELQNSIIRKILDTKDEQLLDYLNSLLTKEKSSDTYQLNKLEKSIIQESLAQYQNGQVLSNEEVASKTKKWLEE
jgi:hypothetical protein